MGVSPSHLDSRVLGGRETCVLIYSQGSGDLGSLRFFPMKDEMEILYTHQHGVNDDGVQVSIFLLDKGLTWLILQHTSIADNYK